MLIYTIQEFEYTNYPYCKNGINIVSQENIKIIDDNWTEFKKKYSNLKTVYYSHAGENCYGDENEFNEFYFTNGIYKDIITNKYYILSFVEIEDEVTNVNKVLEKKCRNCKDTKDYLMDCYRCKKTYCYNCYWFGVHNTICNI